jgi:hypothetical protein
VRRHSISSLEALVAGVTELTVIRVRSVVNKHKGSVEVVASELAERVVNLLMMLVITSI